MHFGIVFGSLVLGFRMVFFSFSNGGREAFRHQFVPFWNHFSMNFVKNDVVLAWELIFQLELRSHASKTAVFDLKNEVFGCLSFSRFFIFSLFFVSF